jgi:hypothetical protein
MSKEVRAVALAILFITLGLLVLWISKTVVGVTGDAVYVFLLLAPVLVYAIASDRLKELRGPGDLAVMFREPQDAITQTTLTPNEKLAQAVLQPGQIGGPGLLRTAPGATPVQSLNLSANPAIVAAVQDAARSTTPNPVQVNLGSGQDWWSTRLYLLAALTDDYTRVPYLVFLTETGGSSTFVGLATPRETRRAMANLHPELESAYRGARANVNAPAGDPGAEINMVVGMFAGQAFVVPEPQVKQDVTPVFLEDQLTARLHKQQIEVGEDDLNSLRLARRILEYELALVPLTTKGQLDRIVDRCGFAVALARDALLQASTRR